MVRSISISLRPLFTQPRTIRVYTHESPPPKTRIPKSRSNYVRLDFGGIRVGGRERNVSRASNSGTPPITEGNQIYYEPYRRLFWTFSARLSYTYVGPADTRNVRKNVIVRRIQYARKTTFVSDSPGQLFSDCRYRFISYRRKSPSSEPFRSIRVYIIGRYRNDRRNRR